MWFRNKKTRDRADYLKRRKKERLAIAAKNQERAKVFRNLLSAAPQRRVQWTDYQNHIRALSKHTLIGSTVVPTVQEILERKDKLSSYQAKYGVGFYGEEMWLRQIASGKEIGFIEWVHEQLSIFFPPSDNDDSYHYMSPENTDDEEEIGGWKLYSQEKPLADHFNKHYFESAFDCDYVFILTSGDTIRPDNNDLCFAYTVLHDLPYYLEILGKMHGENRTGAGLYCIRLYGYEPRWAIEVSGEYAIWDIEFDRKLAQVIDPPWLQAL